MAIKGKSRPRGRSSTAGAPRAAPVEVKPPFLLRRWVQVTGAFLVGIAVVMIAIWAVTGVHRMSDQRAKANAAASARAAVQQWKGTVDSTITQIGGDPNSQTSPAPFPQLSQTLSDMAAGNKAKDAANVAAQAQKQAKTAADAMEAVTLSGQITGKGLDAAEAGNVLNSQSGMVSAIRLYGEVAGLVRLAAGSDAVTAKALVARAQNLEQLASKVFANAYSQYQEALISVGIFNVGPQPGPGGLGGFPGGAS